MQTNESSMPAFSSSSPSCQPSFVGKRLLVLSSNTTTLDTSEDVLPDPVFKLGGADDDDIQRHFLDPPTENLLLRPAAGYLCYSPSLRKKRAPVVSINDKCNRKRPPISKIPKAEVMETTYPGHLHPSDHPILNDFLKPKASPQIALRSFSQDLPFVPTGPSNTNTTITVTPAAPTPASNGEDRTERRRSKRFNQPAGRYRTTPVTLEEIREIDEELYAKQHPPKKEETADDSVTNGKRTSPYSTCSNAFGIHGSKKHFPNGALDFKCTYMTKTKLAPGRALWSLNSNNHRHRSQESLAHLQLLPTIPEEWRQQHQQQKSAVSTPTNGEPEKNAGPVPITVMVRSPSDPTPSTSYDCPTIVETTESCCQQSNVAESDRTNEIIRPVQEG